MIGHDGQNDLINNPERAGVVPYLKWFENDERTAVCQLSKNYRGWISQHADKLTMNLAKNLMEDQ